MKQSDALKILKSGANVFLTGEAGSGKTYVINEYIAYLRSHSIEPAITASTGIAATHIGGMTIHSWCGIGIKDRLSSRDLAFIASSAYVKKRVLPAKVLIIDEISMLAPETLQLVDLVCRTMKKNQQQPFGGIQVVLVGDFFQLPPVQRKMPVMDEFSQELLFDEDVLRFSFDAPVWQQADLITCYIDEQHRQDDSDLSFLLAKIRSNSFDEEALALIQDRKIEPYDLPEGAPKLFTHNANVDTVNDRMLARIPGQTQRFQMITKGHEALVNVMKNSCLSPENLILKIGASVMFTKNNPTEGYVNGTLGTVEDFDKKGMPIVRTKNGDKIVVSYSEWAVEEDGKIKGRISQLPLRLAWAITVHKSQGISLDEAVIDLSKVFEYGQGYVAISRVRRLTGLYILGWNEKAFQIDPAILEKDYQFRDQSAVAEKTYSELSEMELKELQDSFIINCEGKFDIENIVIKSKKAKVSTADETLQLWNEGKNLAEIAEIRHLNPKTIFSHIEDLVKEQKVSPQDIMRIIPGNLISELPKIQAAFKQLDTDKLSPVFNHFNEKYTYDELKLARMSLEPIKE